MLKENARIKRKDFKKKNNKSLKTNKQTIEISNLLITDRIILIIKLFY